jgi:hypothetical protein
MCSNWLAVCPDLAIVHCLQALAQLPRFLRTAENTPGAMAKCFNNQFSFIFVEQHNHARLRLQCTQLLQCQQAGKSTVLKCRADQAKSG